MFMVQNMSIIQPVSYNSTQVALTLNSSSSVLFLFLSLVLMSQHIVKCNFHHAVQSDCSVCENEQTVLKCTVNVCLFVC